MIIINFMIYFLHFFNLAENESKTIFTIIILKSSFLISIIYSNYYSYFYFNNKRFANFIENNLSIFIKEKSY